MLVGWVASAGEELWHSTTVTMYGEKRPEKTEEEIRTEKLLKESGQR